MLKIAGRLDEKRIDGSFAALQRDLDFFQGLGVEAIEIPIHGMNIIRYGRLDRRLLAQAVAIFQGYDFVYSVHAPDPVNLMNTEQEELHQSVLRSAMDFASAVGAGVVVCHAGQYMPHNQFPMNRKAFVTKAESMEFLRCEAKVLEHLADDYPGITIAVENARPYLFHSPYCYAERLEPLKAQILDVNRKNVGINLDIGHLYLASRFYGFDFLEEIGAVRDLIIHCHVHDNFGLPTFYNEKEQAHLIPFGRGDCHMPVGWGEIPIEAALAEFVIGWEGILVMELRGRYYEWVRESLENLMTICLSIDGADNRSVVGE